MIRPELATPPMPAFDAADAPLPHLVLVGTVSHGFETYLAGQPRRLAERFRVTLVSSPGAGLTAAAAREGVGSLGVPMTRSITPLQDLQSLVRLFRLFRSARPDIVQSYSPKAGLLAMIAAKAARVPVRVHGVVGLPLTEARGLRAAVLATSERVTYRFATHVTCNSVHLADWIQSRLSRRPIEVIGRGSINGVDTHRFRPPSADERRRAQRELGVDPSRCVLLFVGRLVRDKGVSELVQSFQQLPTGCFQLVVVGDTAEGDDSVDSQILSVIDGHPDIVRIGWRADVCSAYWGADAIVLPSYREGMPNVLLEAAACGLALVATAINGCDEIVRPGENGSLVPVRDVGALTTALLPLQDRTVCRRLGAVASEQVRRDFDHQRFCTELLDSYETWLQPREEIRS